MPPSSRQQSPAEAGDVFNATPRVRPTRSTVSRDSSASTAANPTTSRRNLNTPSGTPFISRTPSDRFTGVRSKTASSIARQNSSSFLSATPSSQPRSRLLKPSHSVASSNAPVKLRKRTETEPNGALPKLRSLASISSFIGKQASGFDAARSSIASVQEDFSRYADSEPIKAYLRIRPPPEDANKEQAKPYIQVVSDSEVLMHPPKELEFMNARTAARARIYNAAPSTKYIFSKVFAPGATASSNAQDSTSQTAFFQSTTLPMVEELLQGQSGLIFTYGVTNSGKSYTVMGGDGPGEAGILPRALDVIFNSIQGVESKSDIRPLGNSSVERCPINSGMTPSPSMVGINPFTIPGISRKQLNDAVSRSLKDLRVHERDETKVPVDRNLRYSVWVSYVEVYNEKLFDLLDTLPAPGTGGLTRSESVRGSNWSIATMANAGPDGNANGSNIILNRRPLSLKSNPDGGGKYVVGLKEIKVTSATEARELLIRGQENRAVFGTMANRASSRSHGVFTIRVVREHGGAQNIQGGEEDLSSSFTTARLSIVDLAGSERVGNTGLTSGDRLKEAGNINKSLMCLGQCLETLRKNQSRAAVGIDIVDGPPPSWNSQSRANKPEHPLSSGFGQKRRLSIVPFRHSKLTELFQSFFTGEGKAVMIVNANPYDTGFDENSHVMKFSAVAKEVGTIKAQPIKAKPIPASKGNDADDAARGVPDNGSKSQPARKTGSEEQVLSGSEKSGTHDITIIEDDSDQGDESDPFVDLLVQAHEELRQKLYAAEMRCATIETQVREEMANQMEQRLLEMEALYNQRMLSDAEQNEQFVNRKIDLLVRTNVAQDEQESDNESSDNESIDSDDEAEVDRSLAPHTLADDAIGSESDSADSEDSDDERPALRPGKRSESTGRDRLLARESPGAADSASHEVESVDFASAHTAPEDAMTEEGSDDDKSDDQGSDEREEQEEDDSAQEEEATDTEESEPESDAQDSSFDVTAATAQEEEEEELPKSRRQSSRRSTLTKTNKRKSSSTASLSSRRSTRTPFQDCSQNVSNIELSDISDASMIAEDCVTPKPKRKLRKKAIVQEDDMVEQIGDSSLVEAVYQGSTNMTKSVSRKSLR